MKNRSDFAYQAVYRYLVRLISEVQTNPAKKLPSLRQLARRLRVSISTVQSAYSLLEEEGRVRAVPKSGYFALPVTGDMNPQPSACDDNLLQGFHHHARRPGMKVLGHDEPTLLQSIEVPLLAVERELLRHCPRPLDPGFQPFGDLELRKALAARYTRDATHCWYPENVYLGPDAPGMLKAVIDTLKLRGATVLVESPCCWIQLRLLHSLGVRVLELPMDESGSVELTRLARLLLENHIALALLSSSFNPVSGNALPPLNLEAMLRLLDRHRVWVLENDSHGELAFVTGRLRPRDLIDPQRLLILGAFDKALSLETPYGYLLCQQFDARWQQYFLLRAHQLPPLRQKAIARLCASGRLGLHLRELRGLLSQRVHAMERLLERDLGRLLTFERPVGGGAIWARSIHPVDMRQVFEHLLTQRIVVTPGELFSLSGRYSQHLRIACTDWHDQLPGSLRELARALKAART